MPCAPSSFDHFELKRISVFPASRILNDLRLVGPGIGLDLLVGERRAGRVAAGGVADHAGEIADQELHPVTEVLELPQLVDDHRVAEVQVGGGRIEAELHPEGASGLQLPDEVLLDQQFLTAAFDRGQLMVDVHRIPVIFCLDELKLPDILRR